MRGKGGARGLLLQVHRWTGLGLALVFLFIALTGLPMALRSVLEVATEPELHRVSVCETPKSLDAGAAAARAAYPAAALDYVRYTTDPGAPWMFRFLDQNVAYVDPCTASVLGFRWRFGGPFGTLEKLHRFRFFEGGETVAGILALTLLIVFVGGGLYLWWPRRLALLRPALTFQRRLKGWPRWLSLHKVAGVYAAPLIILAIATGLPQAFPWYRAGIYQVMGSPVPAGIPRLDHPEPATSISLADQAAILAEMEGDAREVLVHIARKPDQAIEIYSVGAHAPHANARAYVILDPRDGRVISHTPYDQSSLGHKVYFWTLSWHTALIGGPVGPIAMMIAASAVATLALTGLVTFFRRRA